MRVEVRNRCPEFEGYRAARVKSLFNVDSGAHFDLDADLPIEGADWAIGLVVGPSGSGKSSIGARLFGPGALWSGAPWPDDAPIIEALAPGASFEAVTGALTAVGLGSVPAWLRPWRGLASASPSAIIPRSCPAIPARARWRRRSRRAMRRRAA